MFFAAVAPAITFGAVYEKVTGHYIGAIEMIAATAWFGILYGIIGGSPPMINGGTGPVLAFVAVLYKLSDSLGVPFMPFYAWTGLWIMVYCLIGGFMNINKMIKHATRFTDEVFAMLISLIFIINAFGNPFSPAGLYYYFKPDHASHEVHEDDEECKLQKTCGALLLEIFCASTLTHIDFASIYPQMPIQVLPSSVLSLPSDAVSLLSN